MLLESPWGILAFTYIQPAVDQHTQVLFLWAAFQPLFPKPVALHGVVVTQVQDLALSLVELHTIQTVRSPMVMKALPQSNTHITKPGICLTDMHSAEPVCPLNSFWP